MVRLFTFMLLSLALLPKAQAEVRFTFDPNENRWQLANEFVNVSFRLSAEGLFQFEQFSYPQNGDTWQAPQTGLSSPIQFTMDGTAYGAGTSFQLVQNYQEDAGKGGRRQVIEFQDLAGRVRIHLALELYPLKPVLRYWLDVYNLQSDKAYIQAADMLPWRFDDRRESYQWFRVNQWAVVPREQNFEPIQTVLSTNGGVQRMQSGARGLQCGWWALSDSRRRGMFAGWEFDGLVTAAMRQAGEDGYVQMSAAIEDLNHPIGPGEFFHVPAGFIGLYHGDWDEAGYRTQRFVEKILAAPMPDDTNFPYVAWDSWGYNQDFDEALLKRNAEAAAKLGFELFIVDLGWARHIGDWYSNRDKFPSGMQTLSDYVHSLGMKFGLHFALAEASPDAPVLQENPDWTTSEDYYYFGAKSLCLSNKPTRDWIIDNAVRMIQRYNVDWVLQDGENMVKKCTKTTHTHDAKDSNYSNAVDGLDYVLREIQRQTPGTVWENCEDGGNMMTFNMVKNYVTSITNDANGALGARQAAYGATYPFPPRYVDRYMPDESVTSYTTRSFVFGGPWIQMNRLADLTPADQEFLGKEIQVFKKIRGTVRDGKVFHLTPPPGAYRTDAIQSYNQATDSGVAVITRNNAIQDFFEFRPSGLNPAASYTVTFQDNPSVNLMTGEELMNSGVTVKLAGEKSAEVVYITPR